MARSVCLPWQRFSIPHSSVIFSTVTSGNPPSKEALSLSLARSLSAAFHSCHLLTFLCFFLSLPSSRSFTPPCFFICGHGKSSVNPHPHCNSNSSTFSLCQRPLEQSTFSQLQILAALTERIRRLHQVSALKISTTSLKYTFLLFTL